MSDFCPIFVRFSMSDFLCPIFFVRFFYPIFVRFILSDVFISDFLSYFLCPISCPIFARFDVSSFCPIFCPLFLADLLSHFLCDFSSKKMEHVSSCIATFVMYYQCVSVFIIMTVSYCTHLRGCDIAAATSGFGRDPGTLRKSLRLEKKT